MRAGIFVAKWTIKLIPSVVRRTTCIEQEHVVDSSEMFTALTSIGVRCAALPDDLVLELILAKNLIMHHFDVMAGVPVAVIIEAARLLKHAR